MRTRTDPKELRFRYEKYLAKQQLWKTNPVEFVEENPKEEQSKEDRETDGDYEPV